MRGYPQLPAQVRAAFPTAAEIPPEWHLRMQAAVQRHVDAAVSKTVNLPATATVDDIRAIYFAAWRAKVKGITVARCLRLPLLRQVDHRRVRGVLLHRGGGPVLVARCAVRAGR